MSDEPVEWFEDAGHFEKAAPTAEPTVAERMTYFQEHPEMGAFDDNA